MPISERASRFSANLNFFLDKMNAPKRGRSIFIKERLPIDVSEVAIRKWLSGRGMPDSKKIGYLCEMVGASIDELYGYERNDIVTYHLPIIEERDVSEWYRLVMTNDYCERCSTESKVSDTAFVARVKALFEHDGDQFREVINRIAFSYILTVIDPVSESDDSSYHAFINDSINNYRLYISKQMHPIDDNHEYVGVVKEFKVCM